LLFVHIKVLALLTSVETKTVYSVLRFIADALEVGALFIVFVIFGSLFQHERARKLIFEIRRALKDDSLK
jgi:hypothetical protein